MIHQRLMIAGLRKQHQLLQELLCDIASSEAFEPGSEPACGERIDRVAGNLKKLRSIQKTYCISLHAPDCLQ